MQCHFLKRTWAEIDLDALSHNYRYIRSKAAPSVKIMGVVKADAYGHGVKAVASVLSGEGCDWFAVSNLEEAIQLREFGFSEPILILGFTPAEEAGQLAGRGISQTVYSAEYARALSKEAEKAGVTVRIHIKVDTGMSRIGFFYQSPEEDGGAVEEAACACTLPGLDPEGIFTHFAVADSGTDGEAFTQRQFDSFQSMIGQLERRGIRFRLRHCCNSAGTLTHPDMHLDMVRPGIILYGHAPSSLMEGQYPLKPVMSLRSVISLVKTIPAGATVSYGRTYTAEQPMRVATVPIGYADGYPRPVSGRAKALVHGKEVPLIGRVCMDQLMMDVSAVPRVQEGDVVTLFGRDGEAFLPMEQISSLADTISYETACLIGRRVPRVYLRQGEPVDVFNAIISQK
ncbi:MAG: alanine racemase [Clostridiales bacterium]|nr:alanine racemase [Clostridiales bacterium]